MLISTSGNDEYSVNYLMQCAIAVTSTTIKLRYCVNGVWDRWIGDLGKYFCTSPTDLNGLETNVFTLAPGNYHIGTGISKAKNWPVDDSESFAGALIVFGRYNQPENNRGYRAYLLATNKSKMYYACEWWGNTPKWYVISGVAV